MLLEERHGVHSPSVEGSAVAPDLASAWAAFNQLNRMPGVGASGDLVVYENVPKSLRVRQGDVPRASAPRAWNFKWAVDYQLTFVALDPFKRGATMHTQALAAGAAVSVTNDGNVAASLNFTTTGGGTVIVRQNGSGQILRTRTSVGSGTTLDGASRRVTTSGGVDIFPMGTPSEWLSIPALSTVTLTNQGTAPLSAAWYDTYA
ncbi:hypothetical protein [Terrabacter sp. C0L_2]|uniref:hypothetical protein n=1 Tax=Terrabacter sp. C0L_2 TaxID=3108389 RepID=UPI002ED50E61|nr:hypothetical protein U5C87_17830 [Terrabacter sp. C0L_2]